MAPSARSKGEMGQWFANRYFSRNNRFITLLPFLFYPSAKHEFLHRLINRIKIHPAPCNHPRTPQKHPAERVHGFIHPLKREIERGGERKEERRNNRGGYHRDGIFPPSPEKNPPVPSTIFTEFVYDWKRRCTKQKKSELREKSNTVTATGLLRRSLCDDSCLPDPFQPFFILKASFTRLYSEYHRIPAGNGKRSRLIYN